MKNTFKINWFSEENYVRLIKAALKGLVVLVSLPLVPLALIGWAASRYLNQDPEEA